MYTTRNFKTKKAFKQAVSEWLARLPMVREKDPNCDFVKRDGKGVVAITTNGVEMPLRDFARMHGVELTEPVTLYAPGLGSPATNGTEYVEGPHYPEPHRWYAQVTVRNGIVVAVK